MEQLDNPYTPGAGRRPVALTGRDAEQRQFAATLARLRAERSAACLLLVGLRGVGKTVLLSRFARQALEAEWVVAEHEFDVRTDLLGTMVTLARSSLLQIAPPSLWRRAARGAASTLAGIQATYQLGGLTLSVSGDDERQGGAGDSGDMSRDLTDLLVSLGETAREHGTGVVFLFDELQFAAVEPLGALVAGLHKVAQRELPLTLVGAGLPQLRGVLAEAKSYAERLFDVVNIGPLTGAAAEDALAEPARRAGHSISPGAIDHVLAFTEGYPYFIQTYGDHLWRLAPGPDLTELDARVAESAVRAALDDGFFRFRTDRLTTRQRRYLRAMAEHGSGEVSSGDVATTLGMKSSAEVGRVRDELIKRGLIYSPRLGQAAFTVPQFDDYLRRRFELEQHPSGRKTADPEGDV